MNNGEWKDIEEREEIKKSGEIQKYGMDISEYFKVHTSDKNVEKRLRKKRFFSIVIIFLILFTIVYSRYDYNVIKYTRKVKDLVQMNCSSKIIEKDRIMFMSGNGFYTFELENNPEIITHAFMKDDKFGTDINARIYKYYFEKWNSPNKRFFIVNESYKDVSYLFINKKDWILNYKTYIDVNNYSEMLDAFEKIVEFISYMGDSYVLIDSYIRFNGELILPHNVSIQTYEHMKAMAIRQYISIVKKYNLSTDDIPKDVMQQYWNEDF